MSKRSSKRRRKQIAGNPSDWCEPRRRASRIELHFTGFRVTCEALPHRSVEALPPEVRDYLPSLHRSMSISPQRAMAEVKFYADRFPGVACFQNWLTKCYLEMGRPREARALARRTVEQHPDYFFGIVVLAELLLADGELDEVDELLGHPKLPTSLAPGRREFHLSEVVAYFHACGRFHLLRKQFKASLTCLEFLEEIAPDHESTRSLARLSRFMLAAWDGDLRPSEEVVSELQEL